MKGIIISRFMVMAVITGLVGGCAALDQDARINFLEGQMTDVLQKSAEWDVTAKDVRIKLADYGAQMDTALEQVQTLSGEIQDMESGTRGRENPIFSQQGTAEDIRMLKERVQYVEARVGELEKNISRQGLSSAPIPPTAGAAEAPPVQVTKPPAVAPVPSTSKDPPVPEDQKDYNQAIAAMKEKQYEKSIRLFRGFIKKYSGNDLGDNAQYWIGECYYAQKKYEEAIIEFEEVIQLYPKGDKVPAALLKEALAFHELKDNTPARQILKKLIDQYPESEEAKLAKDKLNEIK